MVPEALFMVPEALFMVPEAPCGRERMQERKKKKEVLLTFCDLFLSCFQVPRARANL